MTQERISSPQNQWFKQLVQLRESRRRKATGLTRLDGTRELLRVLDAGLSIEILVACPERIRDDETQRALERAESASRPALLLDERLYEQLRYGDRDEGVCAAVRWQAASLEEFEPAERCLLLVLEGVEKPGNLGAALRTADACGVDAVLLCDSAIDPSNPNAVRASLGTLFTVPVLRATSSQTVEWLRAHSIEIFAAVVGAEKLYTECDLRASVAIALGSEHAGLSAVWRGPAATGMHLPMRGHADSLNVSVAAGVVLYEALRQRSG